jgi:hypothetical protein
MKRTFGALASCFALASLFFGDSASAAPPTKDECIETHSRAQDARDRGQLADAKRLFLLCAQSSCPALIQSDCSKFGEDLARSVPSVSFSARDPKGNDLPDTQVFVDGNPVATRLDDGKAHDLDPGKHTIKFVHNGKESTATVVLAVGERGRNISVTIGEAPAGPSTEPARPSTEQATTTESRPTLPLVVAGLGGALLVTGGVLLGVGLGGVPGRCSTSSNECAAPPGDPVFDDASSSVNLANLGLGLGIGGAIIGLGGLIWYFSSSRSERPASSARSVPYTNGRGTSSSAAFRFAF